MLWDILLLHHFLVQIFINSLYPPTNFGCGCVWIHGYLLFSDVILEFGLLVQFWCVISFAQKLCYVHIKIIKGWVNSVMQVWFYIVLRYWWKIFLVEEGKFGVLGICHDWSPFVSHFELWLENWACGIETVKQCDSFCLKSPLVGNLCLGFVYFQGFES